MFPALISRCFLLMMLVGVAATSLAQDRERWHEAVRPTYRYEKSVIMIAPFNTSGTTLETDTLSRIIRNDLMLSGFFEMPADQVMANRQNMIDHRQGTVNFDFWQSKMNVDHYLMGGVRESDGRLTARVVMYDVATRQQIINREFSNTKARMRDLAHQISDAVILQLKGVEGVCRTNLLFATEQLPGVREVAIMDWDGFAARPLTNFGKLATMPVWGAKGSEMYFTSYHGNRAVIYGMQFMLDNTGMIVPGQTWPIAAYGGTNHSAAWSPQAQRLVAVLSKDGNSEIYTMGRDGKNLKRLTRTKATEGSPTWSPDGRQIAFTSNEAGGVHVFVMNADGSNKRRVSSSASWNDAVSWSPDGGRLAFVKRSAGQNDIYVADVKGESVLLRRLTMNQGNNESPTWAPNGTHLAFSSDRTGQWQIYLMLDDGSNQRQLTSTGRNTLPDWGPIPK